MAEDPHVRRPENPRDMNELADESREQKAFAQIPPLEPPIRPLPLPIRHAPPGQIISDDPGASASGYVSMLAKGQIGEPDPQASSAQRHIPMAREVAPEVLPENIPPKLDPLRRPGPRPKPRRPWWWHIPTLCYSIAACLMLVGIWASVATAGIFIQQNLIPGFAWDDDTSQLLAMLLLLSLPVAIILAMIGLYMKEKITR